MKTIGILGSTGSIGQRTLDIIKENKKKFNVDYLYTNSDYKTLFKQIQTHKPNYVCINSEDAYNKLFELINNKIDVKIIVGVKDCLDFISNRKVSLVLNSIVGIDGLKSTISVINNKIDIALANKESLVLAGKIISNLSKKNNTNIFPVDSEHSAIWQCLKGEDINEVEKIILTASGGPFRDLNISEFSKINIKDALNHPNWNMGNKITIDSATMMNKGFEIIETYWLFNIDYTKIDILVHPQSIIHSMVEFKDKSVKAQLGVPDMMIPINYALNYPSHSFLNIESLDLSKLSNLTFEKPDLEKFKCIKLAYSALKRGGSDPAVLNIANDILVDLFLNSKIKFIDISKYIEIVLENYDYLENPTLDDIYYLMDWVRIFLKERLKNNDNY